MISNGLPILSNLKKMNKNKILLKFLTLGGLDLNKIKNINNILALEISILLFLIIFMKWSKNLQQIKIYYTVSILSRLIILKY